MANNCCVQELSQDDLTLISMLGNKELGYVREAFKSLEQLDLGQLNQASLREEARCH